MRVAGRSSLNSFAASNGRQAGASRPIPGVGGSGQINAKLNGLTLLILPVQAAKGMRQFAAFFGRGRRGSRALH